MTEFLSALYHSKTIQGALMGMGGAFVVDLRTWAKSDLPWSWKVFFKHLILGATGGGGFGTILGGL